MDKAYLVEQLGEKVRNALQQIHRANAGSQIDARTGASRAINLARGTGLREVQAREALDALDSFRPKPLKRGEPIGLGAVVEVEDGNIGRTLFVAPVAAGEELTGPDGDGIFQVVTPSSPFGKALIGKRVGDDIQVTIQGETTDWTVTYAG